MAVHVTDHAMKRAEQRCNMRPKQVLRDARLAASKARKCQWFVDGAAEFCGDDARWVIAVRVSDHGYIDYDVITCKGYK